MENQTTESKVKTVVVATSDWLCSFGLRMKYRVMLWRVRINKLPRKIVDAWHKLRGETWRVELGYGEPDGTKYDPVIYYTREPNRPMPDIGSTRSDGPGFLYRWDITRTDLA